jgi:hypothetical protein
VQGPPFPLGLCKLNGTHLACLHSALPTSAPRAAKTGQAAGLSKGTCLTQLARKEGGLASVAWRTGQLHQASGPASHPE